MHFEVDIAGGIDSSILHKNNKKYVGVKHLIAHQFLF